MATASARSVPELQEAKRALGNLSLAKTKTLVFQLGVSRRDIHHIDARYSGDAVKKELLIDKCLDSDPSASWDKLVSGIGDMIDWKSITYPPSTITVKIVVCGSYGAGKTEFINRFVGNIPQTSAIGPDVRIKTLRVGERSVRMHVWDTPRLPVFKPSARSYLRQAQGIVLLYDVASQLSFQRLSEWIWIIEEMKAGTSDIVLVENTQDTEGKRQVSRESGEVFARVHGFGFFRASSTTGDNVCRVFESLASRFVSKSAV